MEGCCTTEPAESYQEGTCLTFYSNQNNFFISKQISLCVNNLGYGQNSEPRAYYKLEHGSDSVEEAYEFIIGSSQSCSL